MKEKRTNYVGRNRVSFKGAVHYNNNGRKACSTQVINPLHTEEANKVTCRYCLMFIRRRDAKDFNIDN